MAKILECAKVDPSSGCKHVVRVRPWRKYFRKPVSTPRNTVFGK